MATAFIPVRGGSKSIPGKNIRMLCGRPLLHWMMEALDQAGSIGKIVVATDSWEIKDAALSFGSDKVTVYDRNPANATDASSTESVVLEYLESEFGPDNDEEIFVLAQATSPLTQVSDVEGALVRYKSSGADSLLTTVKVKRFYWTDDGKPVNYDPVNRPRRQDFAGYQMENGALYISTVGRIRKSRNRLSGRVSVYEMPEITGLEIDEEADWIAAEAHLSCRSRNGFKSRKVPRLFAVDIDGVMTDGGMYYSENGDELKKFNTRDGKGIELIRSLGIPVAIITSEDTNIVARRAGKLHIDYLRQGIREKLRCLEDLCRECGIGLDEVAYIGDDHNDKEVLMRVGFAACPNDAVKEIRTIPGIRVLSRNGGSGAVREWTEILLPMIKAGA